MQFTRGTEGYEGARRATVWNARTPERYPEVIVQAADAEEIVRAVRSTRDAGMSIGVRSGGHSWAGNHVRDGGLLIDASGLRDIEIDPDRMTASVGPGCPGNELSLALAEHDLFFPGGHCPGVCVGGYLLQGGFGWNGRVHGPACMSVDAIDVVTADGERLHADAEHHPELLWAARGAGPGFFAFVTRFHLRLYPRPKVIANGLYVYPIELLDEVFRWAFQIAPSVERTMELMVFTHRNADQELEIVVTGPVLVDTDEEARVALSVLETCPVRDQAKFAAPDVRLDFPALYAGVKLNYPDDHRYSADNMWTHASVDELLPGLRRIAETLPEAPSHMMWMNWRPGTTPPPARPDMAFSVEDDTYIALYGVWSDDADDAANVAWPAERMREMEHLSTGIQLADENLGRRPARFLGDRQLSRIDELRDRYDPDRRFHPWMGR